jgi:putative Ca2+/H+ antiporter (TMEM165/GDT1 family)
MRVVVSLRPGSALMETVLTSLGLVAVSEIGDKTQLLAILLAARFGKPWPIIAGIFCATVANHLMAATIGYFLSDLLSGLWFKLLVGAGFIAMGMWALIPDKADDTAHERSIGGVFATTAIAFFLVEIGDKTQIATSLLAARFHDIPLVALGTTMGMMIADAPAVFLGEAATRIAPLALVRWVSAAIFVILGAGVIIAALWR